jgi:hypothetical protein
MLQPSVSWNHGSIAESFLQPVDTINLAPSTSSIQNLLTPYPPRTQRIHNPPLPTSPDHGSARSELHPPLLPADSQFDGNLILD